ncbi:MAG TPA: peptide chain release factor 2 [Gaiellaceae bacterium]|nr:peptide chain release factor 2 [Gaiellaceae bacterium]
MITFDPDRLVERRAELEAAMGAPGFWDDQAGATRISTEHARLTRKLERYERLQREHADAGELLSLGEDEDEISQLVAALEGELGRLQEDALFDGQYDAGDAVLEIHAGTGGTDAQDWAEMLLRMYLRWAADRGFQTETIEASAGEEAGLKSATVTVKGENAYGTLKAERGVHRLVRLSPFDSAHRRHTAFAQVVVAPLLPDDAPIEIDESDLRIDTYRSSGAGGQHVNKTDSAVRITHLPTGIVVQCQNERSQTSNKATALRILRSRLAEVEEEKREAELARERGAAQDIGFGSQIRSYVLHPYQLVKDHRTDFEVGNIQSVLDGGLDGFVRAYLLAKAAGQVV